MSRKDDDYILEAYKSMVKVLKEVNESLSEVIIEQHETIIRLQATQVAPNNKKEK